MKRKEPGMDLAVQKDKSRQDVNRMKKIPPRLFKGISVVTLVCFTAEQILLGNSIPSADLMREQSSPSVASPQASLSFPHVVGGNPELDPRQQHSGMTEGEGRGNDTPNNNLPEATSTDFLSDNSALEDSEESAQIPTEKASVEEGSKLPVRKSWNLRNAKPPRGTVQINEGASVTNARDVKVAFKAEDDVYLIVGMKISWDGNSWQTFQGRNFQATGRFYRQTSTFNLSSSTAPQKIYVQYLNSAGKWSEVITSNEIRWDPSWTPGAPPPNDKLTPPPSGTQPQPAQNADNLSKNPPSTPVVPPAPPPQPMRIAGGTLDKDTVWKRGTYIIEGEVLVPEGVTLTIEAGSLIKFSGYHRMVVRGTLNAAGTTEAPILFTSGKADPKPDDWEHILISGPGSARSEIRHWKIEYSRHGLGLNNSGIKVSHITGTHNLQAITIEDRSTAELTDLKLSENQFGIRIFGSNPRILNSTITGNQTGIQMEDHYGINPKPAVHGSRIHGNTEFNARFYGWFADANARVDFTGNWWGTADPGAIAQGITDHDDQSAFPYVDYTPFLTFDPATLPPPQTQPPVTSPVVPSQVGFGVESFRMEAGPNATVGKLYLNTTEPFRTAYVFYRNISVDGNSYFNSLTGVTAKSGVIDMPNLLPDVEYEYYLRVESVNGQWIETEKKRFARRSGQTQSPAVTPPVTSQPPATPPPPPPPVTPPPASQPPVTPAPPVSSPNDKTLLPDGREIVYVRTAPYEIQIFSKNVGAGLKPAPTLEKRIGNIEAAPLDETKAVKLTLENGMETFYIDGNLVEVRTPSGIRISSFILNSNKEFIEAVLTYPDGTRDFYWNGFVIRRTTPDKTITDFLPDGRIARENFEKGILQYTYERDSRTGENRTRVLGTDGTYALYDEIGILRETRSKKGELLEYFRADEPSGGYRTMLNPTAFRQEDPKTMLEAFYDKNGTVLLMRFIDGSRAEFLNGRLNKVFDPQGKETALQYLSEAGIFEGLKISRGNAAEVYDAKGFLLEIETSQGKIDRKVKAQGTTGQQAVDLLLELAGGAVLEDFEVDPSGRILTGILKTQEGIKQTIKNGVLTGFETVDGKIYEVQGNKAFLTKWNFGDGTTVIFGSQGKSVDEILFPGKHRLHNFVFDEKKNVKSYTETFPDGSWRKFENGKLVEQKLANGPQIHYGTDGWANHLRLPDGGEYGISRSRQPERIVFRGMDSEYVFLPDGALTQFTIRGLTAEIDSAGRIKKISTPFGQVQAPVLASNGILSGTVELKDGTRLVISNGNWIQALRPSGTRVDYENGKVDRIQTAQAGVYRVVSVPTADGHSDFRLRLESLAGRPELPLVPFLADPIPGAASEIAEILLARPLQNSLEDLSKLRSQLGTGNILFFANVKPDSEREEAFQISGSYFPAWNGVSRTPEERNGGLITRHETLDAGDLLPSRVTVFVDMDGDRLKDRLYIENGQFTYWWWQRNTGSGFDPPQKWGGVNPVATRIGPYNEVPGSIRFFEGRHPAVLGDLADMNGDGRPDRVLQDFRSGDYWMVQFNNGSGFDPVVEWKKGIQLLSHPNDQAKYASEARNDSGGKNVQEMIADLMDMDGDGKLDRIVRPYAPPYDYWFFQKNTGEFFEEPVLWKGVDTSFDPDPAIGGSISWHTPGVSGPSGMAELSLLMDMEGDKKPDRVLVKNGVWYIQKNNGRGFDPVALWDSSIRAVPGAPNSELAAGIRWFTDVDKQRWILSDLRDVTGDGLPDRVTVDRYSDQTVDTWWVEVNTGRAGQGFLPAERWTGIYGTTAAETSISQDTEDFRANRPVSRSPSFVRVVSDLTDINGDKIADRIIYKQGEDRWLVQFGTGKGFLPVQELGIRSLSAPAAENTSRYDYLHVSLKAGEALGAGRGYVRVTLQDPANSQSYQEWRITDLGAGWKDVYLKLDPAKPAGTELKAEWVSGSSNAQPNLPAQTLPQVGTAVPIFPPPRLPPVFNPTPTPKPMPQVFVGSMTFLSLRPPDAKDWLDHLLTRENLIAETSSAWTQNLSQFLRGVNLKTGGADALSSVDWQKILGAAAEIQMDSRKEIRQVTNVSGAVTTVENGRTVTALPDGTRIISDGPDSKTASQTTPDGKSERTAFNYGRIRKVERPGKGPLEYSYEFDAQNREIMAVRDTDTGVIEKYFEGLLLSREEGGIEKKFEYDAAGNLTATKIYYKSRLKQTFGHEVSASGNPVLVSESGLREEHGPDGSVVFHTTPEGFGFRHARVTARKPVVTFRQEIVRDKNGNVLGNFQVPFVQIIEDPSVGQVTQVNLTRFDSPEGDAGEYENALPKQVKLKDGTVIRFERVTVEAKEDPQTKVPFREVLVRDVSVTYADGNKVRFIDGKPYEAVSPSGARVSLEEEGGVLKDPSAAALFHFNQAKKIWKEIVIKKWEGFQLPATAVIQWEYALDGSLVTRSFADGTTEIYENGKVAQTISWTGERLVRYAYDAKGNPTGIVMEASRRRLESSVLKLEADLALERLKAIERLKEREEILKLTVDGEILVIRDRLLAIRADIETRRTGILSSLNLPGKAGKDLLAEVEAMFQKAVDQVNAAIASLPEKKKEAYANVESKIKEAMKDVETESKKTFFVIQDRNGRVLEGVVMQEILPLIYHWYREIFGRDPSRREYERILGIKMEGEGAQLSSAAPVSNQAAGGPCDPLNSMNFEQYVQACGRQAPKPPRSPYFDAGGRFLLEKLKAELEMSPEKSQRSAEVNLIRSEVRRRLLCHAGPLPQDGVACDRNFNLSQVLQIPAGDLVSLTRDDALKILAWLDSRSLHFGQSAFIALEILMGSDPRRRVELASRMILADILTGVITTVEKGDLLLSFYAMRRVAAGYGVNADAYKMSYEALKAMYVEACPSGHSAERQAQSGNAMPSALCAMRVIAHVDGNHYVVVTGIGLRVKKNEEGKEIRDAQGNLVMEEVVTFIDPGAGPESEIDPLTVTKEQFLEKWNNPSARVGNSNPTNPSAGFGYVLTNRAPPPLPLEPQAAGGSALEPPGSSAQLTQYARLTTQDEMQVRGAFFTLIGLIIGIIIAVIKAAVLAIVAAVIALVQGLIAAIGAILNAFGTLFTNLFSGNILAGLKGFGTGILKGIGEVGGAFVKAATAFQTTFATGLGLKGTAIGIFLSNSPLLTTGLVGLEFQGVSSVLEAVGVSPKISRTVASVGKLATGVALLATGNPLGLATSLGFIGSGASEVLSLHTTLPPLVTQLISAGTVALGAFAGGFLNGGNVASAIASLKSAAPFLAMDLAGTGISLAGSAFNLDPRLTALIGLPIKAAVGGFTDRAVNGPSIITGIGRDGQTIKIENPYRVLGDVKSLVLNQTLTGAVSIGASIGLDKINAPPVLSSFLPNLISGLVAGGIGTGAGGGGPPSAGKTGEDIWSRLTDNMAKFGKGIVSAGQKVVSFGQKILDFGGKLVNGVVQFGKDAFAKTVDFFSGVFDRKTQEELIKAGNGSITEGVNRLGRVSGSEGRVDVGASSIKWDNAQKLLEVKEGNRTTQIFDPKISEEGAPFGARIALAEELRDGVVRAEQTETSQEISFTGLKKEDVVKAFRDFTLNLSDYANDVLEGSQVGAGTGAKGKLRIGPLQIEAGMSQLEVFRLTDGQWRRSSDQISAASITIGKWSASYNFEEGTIKVKRKFEQGTFNSDLTVSAGANLTDPRTLRAVNVEITINLTELADIDDLFKRRTP